MKRLTVFLLTLILFLVGCTRNDTQELTALDQTALAAASESICSTISRMTQTEPSTEVQSDALQVERTENSTSFAIKSDPLITTTKPAPSAAISTTEPTMQDTYKEVGIPDLPSGTAYPFQAYYFQSRTCLRMEGKSTGRVIDSVSAMHTYLQSVASDAYYANLYQTNPNTGQTLDTFCKKYDDEWFQSNCLVIAIAEAPSGSYAYSITNIVRTDDGEVTVLWRRQAPTNGILTCDIVYWFYLIEIQSDDFSGSDPVTVDRQNYHPN